MLPGGYVGLKHFTKMMMIWFQWYEKREERRLGAAHSDRIHHLHMTKEKWGYGTCRTVTSESFKHESDTLEPAHLNY